MVFAERQTSQQIRHYTIESIRISVQWCYRRDAKSRTKEKDVFTSFVCGGGRTLNGTQNVSKETGKGENRTLAQW